MLTCSIPFLFFVFFLFWLDVVPLGLILYFFKIFFPIFHFEKHPVFWDITSTLTSKFSSWIFMSLLVIFHFKSNFLLFFLSKSLFLFMDIILSPVSLKIWIIVALKILIAIKHMEDYIYHLNHSSVYSSVLLSIFTLSCNWSSELFHLAKSKL